MRLSDFNRYAGDFEKKKKRLTFIDQELANIRRQGINDSQALNAQASTAVVSSAQGFDGFGSLLPLSSRGIFKGLDDE